MLIVVTFIRGNGKWVGVERDGKGRREQRIRKRVKNVFVVIAFVTPFESCAELLSVTRECMQFAIN